MCLHLSRCGPTRWKHVLAVPRDSLEGEGDVIFIQYSIVLKDISICRFVLYCDKLDLIENCYLFLVRIHNLDFLVISFADERVLRQNKGNNQSYSIQFNQVTTV